MKGWPWGMPPMTIPGGAPCWNPGAKAGAPWGGPWGIPVLVTTGTVPMQHAIMSSSLLGGADSSVHQSVSLQPTLLHTISKSGQIGLCSPSACACTHVW